MPYLSQVINNRIEDAADNYVGRLKDILIKPSSGKYDPVKLILVKSKAGDFCIDFKYVDNFTKKDLSVNVLGDKLVKMEIPKNEYTWIVRDILDKQIVDIEGARVVRVNDLRLNKIKGDTNVVAIDISFKGLLRRLGFSWADVFNILKVNLIDWTKAQAVEGGVKIQTLAKELDTLHPADLANIIEDLTLKQREDLVSSMDEKSAAEVVEELDPELQKILFNNLGPKKASNILKKMSIDEIVDLMQVLPKNEVDEYLSYLEKHQKKSVEVLIEYDDDTAGGLMTTDCVKTLPGWDLNKVINEIKEKSSGMRSLLYVYVVDKDNKFLGAVSLRRLLLTEDKTKKVSEIFKSLSSTSVLGVDDDLDEIMELMTKYNLFTAAVLDEDGKMLGIVTIDDVMRELKPNA